jgi:Phosphoglycerate dehydrogenase and related dehydrogenases
MDKYQLKTHSSIAKIGLDKLEGTECSIDENTESPDGILIRSTKLSKDYLKEGLKAISRAGAGVNNIPVDLCTKKGIVVFNTPGS